MSLRKLNCEKFSVEIRVKEVGNHFFQCTTRSKTAGKLVIDSKTLNNQ